jgi:serine/threonine protein kinase
MFGLSQLQHEVQLLHSIRHPNIVSLREVLFVSESQTIYTVTDFADLGSLEGILNGGRVPSVSEVKYIFKEIVKGICHLHSIQVVHQDVKPGNVLLSKSGRVVIADFGLSHPFSMPPFAFGTPLYQAPESVDTGLVVTSCDGKEDVWALGVTLYEMLFGRTPFRGRDVYEIAEEMKNVGLESPPKECEAEAWEVILGMLTIEPARRFSIIDVLNSKYVREAVDQMEFQSFVEIDVPEAGMTLECVEEKAVSCGPEYEFQYIEPRRPVRSGRNLSSPF